MIRIIHFVIVIAMLTGSVAAQTDTTFTYQGWLSEAGEPANGDFDLEFGLWDASSGGNPIGAPQVLNDTPVTDGLFTVQLDFGADALDNSDRWLEISVNGTTLMPRQPITRSPYSIQTRGIFVNEAGNVGIGTTSPAWEFEVANLTPGDGAESGVTANDAGGAIAAYSSTLPPPWVHFAGRVSVFSDLFASGLDLRADADNADIRFYTGGPWLANEQMRITDDGFVGIGTAFPNAKLEIVDPSGTNLVILVTANQCVCSQTTSTAAYARGVEGHIMSTSPGAWSAGVYGVNHGASYDGIGVYGSHKGSGYGVYGESKNGRAVYGCATAETGTNYGVYGRSDSPSGYDFYAGGAGQNYGSLSSIRWKKNVRNIDKPLDKVSRLRGVYFDWNFEHGGHHDVGMIAEEVGAVLPEIVTYENNGIDANGMDYSKLTPLLVEAVNALRAEKDAELESLRAEKDAQISELAERINNLQHLVEQLTSQVKEERQ